MKQPCDLARQDHSPTVVNCSCNTWLVHIQAETAGSCTVLSSIEEPGGFLSSESCSQCQVHDHLVQRAFCT